MADEAVLSPSLNAQPQTAEWAASWWMPRHEAKLQEIKDRERIDLVMIGDSITQGWESANPDNAAWNMQPVWNEFYAHRHALNLGFSGDRTEHVLWRLRNGQLDGLSPKLAIIMIGTNNLSIKRTPDDTAAGVLAIVEEVRTRLPDTKVLLLGVFPRGEQPDNPVREPIKQINDTLQQRADGETVWYLDVGPKFLNDDGVLPKSIMPDGLHPNAKGYAIWAEAVEPTVAELLGG
ncbi:beta-glucosidase [Algisphaera agarilytica]|uniref:Beta-glucosidase n=2 Tax=Algisphaera agarilytica TaxID=1385975 RepID=A0A7X0H952_9BACT|nr:beta-glucosidase [Algisphaera agarilytica]